MATNLAHTDWGSAVVVDPRELERLRHDNARLETARARLGAGLLVFLTGFALATGAAYLASVRADRVAEELRETRRAATRSSLALTALARSHDNILAATQQAPSVGTKSWGRRFTVTKYLPRSPKYGKFDDGLTATLTKADPKARIVAVDPKLIPYGSWVWVEGLGWYRAEDCGSAIKGFRLDLLTATEKDAVEFGKQERFVIVVPPTDA
jgi:3D (Asp-Asp-Asp) domain-containing protein